MINTNQTLISNIC